MHSVPLLIIGGGIAGASLACSLADRSAGAGVALVDVDLWGKYSSSELNGGGVRCTFAEPINVKISLASTKYYLAHAKKLDFRQRGYLWMYDAPLWEASRSFLPVVKQFGLPVEEMDPRELKARFGLLGDLSDLAGATFTPLDGRLSPHSLRMHYLDHAQQGGVQIMDRWEVVQVAGNQPPYRVTLKRVNGRRIKAILEVRGGRGKPRPEQSSEELLIFAERIVNAAGPWAGRVAALYGRNLPVTALPRQVFLVAGDTVDLEPLPFFLDYPQDIYFRHYERDRKPCVLVSWSDPNEPAAIDFSHHGPGYYQQHVKPRLVRRIPALEAGNVIGGWVGHYELSPDKGAIVGQVPQRPGIFNYSGLSAHGVMQSRALGEAMAELLVRGNWPADLNLDELSEQRFAGPSLLQERMYV